MAFLVLALSGSCTVLLDFGGEVEGGEDLPDLLEPRDDEVLAFSAPEECATCHQQHFDEWQMTPHAYAMKDPVFIAMVRLGQASTEGALGQFCVQCHSPTGLATEQTEVFFDEDRQVFDQNLDLDPIGMSGVTCTACHSITNVVEPVNARIVYTPNGTMRGPISDPVENSFHASEYNELFDDQRSDFGNLCGSCHEVVNPKGALVERTFTEYSQSMAKENGKTCVTCHMPAYEGVAASGAEVTNPVPVRTLHRHTFVGVDVSLLPEGEFPGDLEMRELSKELLQTSVELTTSVNGNERSLSASIVNLAGHAVPSGATAERQMWLEVVVRNAAQQIVFVSGTLDAAGDLRDGVASHSAQPGSDPQLVYFGQALIAIEGFGDMSTEEKQAARLEIDQDCISFGQGALRPGSLGTVVDMPWQADWQCDILVPPDAEVLHAYDLSVLPPGSYTATVRLLFRSFPPHFLRKLEVQAGLDPAVKTRVPIVEMESEVVSIVIPLVDSDR